jgi:hypothetical protein
MEGRNLEKILKQRIFQFERFLDPREKLSVSTKNLLAIEVSFKEFSDQELKKIPLPNSTNYVSVKNVCFLQRTF